MLDFKNFKYFTNWKNYSTTCLLLLIISSVSSKVEPGFIYNFKTLSDGQCLTANAYDFHTEIGIFLGQVSTDPCDEGDKAQKWGVILWDKTETTTKLWLYPRKNGLNAITAIPYPDEPLPEKNLVEIIPYEITSGAFQIRSIELNQCVLSRGADNTISYEPCDSRIRAQLWVANFTSEEAVEKSISDRGIFGTVKDFVVYHGGSVISAIRGRKN
ncbi:unnamed protein product [Allacma fusca]|uniref:Uncharacterized protein n=1 Tax=Allacma fusca TaxID=39272 RepID=A0A8J2JZD7_9HEXA|nr:unnamed protein product [Allacma fusca]